MKACLLAFLLATSCFAQAVGTSGAIGISVASSGGGTPASPNGAVQFDLAGAFGGSANFTYIPSTTAPSPPTLATAGTPGATTLGFKASLRLPDGGVSAASTEATIATANAVLDGTNYVIVTAPACAGVTGATVDLYLSTGGGNVADPAFLANVACGATYNLQGVVSNGFFTFFFVPNADLSNGVTLAGVTSIADGAFQFTNMPNTYEGPLPGLGKLIIGGGIGRVYAAIEVHSDGDAHGDGEIGIVANNTYGGYYNYRQNGSFSVPTNTIDKDIIGSFQAEGFAAGYYHHGGALLLGQDGASVGGRVPTAFQLALSSTTEANLSRLFADAQGHIGLGTSNCWIDFTDITTACNATRPTDTVTIFDTTATTGSTSLGIIAGAGDAGSHKVLRGLLNDQSTEKWSITRDGDLTLAGLTTTGAAGSKKVVCVDTSTGRLYASSTGTDCSN